MTPNEDQSCDILAEAIMTGWPVVHSKFGDGAIEVMLGQAGFERSCDGEPQWQDRQASAAQCRWLWKTLCAASRNLSFGQVYMADWATCSDRQGLDEIWARMVPEGEFRMVAYEALHLHRLTPALLNFYRTIRAFGGKKVMVTSWPNHLAVKMLAAEAVYIPAPHDYQQRSDVIAQRTAQLVTAANPDLLLLAGGGVGSEAQGYLLEAGAKFSMLAIGSALDPLFRGRTRRGQVDPAAAREYFKDLL